MEASASTNALLLPTVMSQLMLVWLVHPCVLLAIGRARTVHLAAYLLSCFKTHVSHTAAMATTKMPIAVSGVFHLVIPAIMHLPV